MNEHQPIPILLVEESSQDLSWIEEHLLGLDVELVWSAPGDAALELARERDFCLALFAVETPADCLDTVKLLHSSPEGEHLPIIYLLSGERQRPMPCGWAGLYPGMADYLTLPVEPMLLRNKVLLFCKLYSQRKIIERHNTVLKKTHAQLQKSRERYIRLLGSVSSYVYTVTVAAGLPVNTVHGPGCEGVTGFSSDDYAKDPDLWIRMIHHEDLSGALNAAQRILSEKRPLIFEHRIMHKTGAIRWVRNTLVPHFDAEGRLLNYDGIIIDITERRCAERQLATSVSLLEATLESTADGILVTDDGGKISTFNQQFLSLWRIPSRSVTGTDAGGLLSAMAAQLKQPELFREKLSHLMEHPEEESFDQLDFLDGRVFERYSKPRMMGGRTAGRVWSFRDITERKHLEDQLRHVQKMELVGQLVGGIAHDFNNVLTVILGYGRIARGLAEKDSNLAGAIEQVLDAGGRAAALVRSLLVFNRKQMRFPQPLELNAFVRDLRGFLQRMVGDGIELRTVHCGENLPVHADRGQLEQVLMNLAGNARDAMPQGGSFTIETRITELKDDFFRGRERGEPGRYAHLTVSDDGMGMTEETRKRIFEPYFTTKEIGKGSGLGLSIAYGIVRQHKGIIEVESDPGRGTRFTILVPLDQRESRVESAGNRTAWLEEERAVAGG